MAMFTYEDILAKINSGNEQNNSNATVRLNAIPLDKSTIYASLDDAIAYATTAGNAYEGQIIAVKNNDQQEVYVLDTSAPNGLRKLASGGDASALEQLLNNEISARKADVTFLSSEISTINATTLPELSSKLESNLSIDVRVKAGEGDVLSSYVISQGGTDKTVTIDIPKDKVIETAEVVKITEATETLRVGTYLKITVQNVTDPVYVPVPELASVYSGYDGDTVKVDVVAGENDEAFTISATVKAKSIGTDHLTDELSTLINNVITSDADVRATVETLSGEGEGSFKYADVQLSNALTTVISAIRADANEDLSAEIKRATDAEAFLSSAIDNKIKIQGENVETLNIRKLSQDEYHQLVIDDEIDENTVYVVSSDSLNMYDEKIINLAAGTDDTDAVNVSQLKSVSSDLVEKIEDAVENGVDELSAKVFNGETSLLSTLTAKIEAEATRADAAEQVLSGKIDTLNGDAKTEGSVAKSVADALKTATGYTDIAAGLLSTDYNKKIEDLASELTDGYVPLSVAEEATSDDKLVKTSTLTTSLTALADTLSTDYNDKISNLTFAELTASADETIKSVKQENGKITVEKQSIQIAKSQVTGLETDLANRVLTADLDTWKNQTGLSAAGEGEDNQVVLWKDVKDITTAMHFRDAVTSTAEKSIDAVLAEIADPKKGDVVIDTATTKEYVCIAVDDGVATWRELGDEGIYLTKTEFESWKNDTLEPRLSSIEADVDALSSAISSEVDRATTAEKDLSDKIDALSTYTHALSVSQLVWDIDIINCGSATI